MQELSTQSVCLATKNKLEKKELACGKIGNNNLADSFLFYIIDMNSFSLNAKLVDNLKKILERSEDHISLDAANVFFEQLLFDLNKEVSAFAEKEGNLFMTGFNMVIGFVENKEILISHTGNISGYIFRKNRISTIIETQTSNENLHPSKVFAEVTSGELSNNDQIIFGNEDFFNFISLDRIRETFRQKNLQKEMLQISQHLRRQKIKTANAVIISTFLSDNINPVCIPAEDTFYVDDEDPNIKNFKKNLAKIIAGLKKNLKNGFLLVQREAKKLAMLFREKIYPWIKLRIKVYAPHLKKFFIKTRNKIKNSHIGSLETNNHFGKIKIKAVSYSRKSDLSSNNTITQTIKNCWAILSNIQIFFRRENRKYLYIFMIVIALMIGYGKIKANNEKREQTISAVQLENSFEDANAQFDAYKADAALGRQTSVDQIYGILALAEKAKNSESDKHKAIALIKEIQDVIDESTVTQRTYTTPYAIGENVNKIVLIGSEIYGVNPNGNIYSVDSRDKQSQLVGAVTDGSVTEISYSKSENKIFMNVDDKIFTFSPETKTTEKQNIVDTGFEWEKSSALSTYSTNIYLLSPDTNQISKHIKRDGGYSKGVVAADAQKVSLRNSIDLAIDGNIFALKSDGTIAKFVRGANEPDFAISGIPAPENKLNQPVKLFTDDETSSIFVLDKQANKVLKFDKSGRFATQYAFDGATIDDFVVNAKLQKIWALSGGKIYEGDL